MALIQMVQVVFLTLLILAPETVVAAVMVNLLQQTIKVETRLQVSPRTRDLRGDSLHILEDFSQTPARIGYLAEEAADLVAAALFTMEHQQAEQAVAAEDLAAD
jgi:hypothetical protein